MGILIKALVFSFVSFYVAGAAKLRIGKLIETRVAIC